MPKFNSLFKLGTSALVISLASVLAVSSSSSLQAQDADDNATIEEIENLNSGQMGEQVTVRGEVNEVEPGVSFEIAEDGFLQGSEVLVLNVSGNNLPATTDEDVNLQVTGELGEFVYADVNELYDLDLDPDFYVDYETRPVIFAESITLSPSLDRVTESPDNFYNQELALEGEVGEIKNNMAFTINDDEILGEDDILVINAAGEPMPEEDEYVVVTGMLRPFIAAEFERDYDLTWDLDIQRELEAEYSEKPVLVVDRVAPTAEEEGLFE